MTFPQSRLRTYKDISGRDHPMFYLRPGSAAAFGEKIKSASRKRFGNGLRHTEQARHLHAYLTDFQTSEAQSHRI